MLEECLRVLEDCDPTGERPDPPELADLEQQSLAQVVFSFFAHVDTIFSLLFKFCEVEKSTENEVLDMFYAYMTVQFIGCSITTKEYFRLH